MSAVMRIVTWNVNSLRARLPRVLEFLADQQPDVACLQETKCAPRHLPRRRAGGPPASGAVHSSGGQWAGRRDPRPHGPGADRPGLGLPGGPVPGEARWCEATVEGIRFASVYVPNGRSLDSPEFPRKLAFLDAMASRAAQLGAEPLLIAGDMNIAPADADVYDPAAFAGSTHVTPEERGRLARILDAGELVDAYRSCTPTSPSSPGGTTGPGTSTRAWACASTSPCSAGAWSPV